MLFTDHLRDKLKERLSQPLLGWQAQQHMATEMHRNSRHRIPPNALHAGVLILLYPGAERQLAFPLIRRPQYDGAHSGQIAFPGGKVEPEDGTIVDTALRETKEEIGVSVEATQVVGQLSDLYIPVSRFVVSPVVAFTKTSPAYQPEPAEVAEVLDMSVQDFLNPDNRSVRQITARGVHLEAPAYLINKEVIWGATAMILAEFFAILKEINE